MELVSYGRIWFTETFVDSLISISFNLLLLPSGYCSPGPSRPQKHLVDAVSERPGAPAKEKHANVVIFVMRE